MKRHKWKRLRKRRASAKGALYAHFKSKEELFLALYETKTASSLAKLLRSLDGASTREGKIDAFRSFYINLSKDKDWALIVLEVKLFITRYPEVRERLRQIDEHAGDSIEGALARLFGNSARAAGEALGGIFSVLVLEADLEPNVLSERKMKRHARDDLRRPVGITRSCGMTLLPKPREECALPSVRMKALRGAWVATH